MGKKVKSLEHDNRQLAAQLVEHQADRVRALARQSTDKAEALLDGLLTGAYFKNPTRYL